MSKRRKITIKQCIAFLGVLLVGAIALEIALNAIDPVGRSVYFRKNDFEITVNAHGSTEFDRIFFGNSAVVSAFREDASDSGYVEFGLLLGTAVDLRTMLEGSYITVNESIVLGLNLFTLMDSLDSDPSYIWHRGALEPYVYFHRDRLQRFFTETLQSVLDGNPTIRRFDDPSKYLYFGALSDEELDYRLADFEERFFNIPFSDFVDNLAALEWIIQFCNAHDIRLRVIWMPYNPHSPKPPLYFQVMEAANAIFAAHGIEVNDLSDAFPREDFFDTGHFNDEPGAIHFTREIDLWLNG